MNCVKCQAPLPADAVFCPNCGTRPAPAAAPAPPAGGGVRTYSGLSTVAPMRESTTTALAPGTLFAGRYQVIRKVGEGGMGIVYVAEDTNTGQVLVLKLIHPDLVKGEDAVKRLMAEGLTARQIRHPSIVAVFDVAQADGQPYFTMEFVNGVSLRSWMVDAIRSGRETSLETAVGLMKSMLAGVIEAHRMGVVHRDLKPENVLLCGDPNAGNFDLKILDFGIARAVNAPASARSGGAVGTPLYMAPEQMTSADAVGPPADVYSLTVMFYELLMEAPPQSRWEPVGKSRPGIPKAIDDLIEKGLAARPRSRFSTADELDDAIDAAMGQAPPKVQVTDPIRQAGWRGFGSLSRRAKLVIAGVAAFIVIGVIGNMIGERGLDGPNPQPNPNPQPLPPDPNPPPNPNPPPPPPPAAFNAGGYWLDPNGNRFAVQHDGLNFVANGFVVGYGTVNMSGNLTIAGAQFVLRTSGGIVMAGNGRLYMCAAGMPHLAYALADGTTGDFRINHVQ